MNAEADDEMTEAEKECYAEEETSENDKMNKEKRMKSRKLMDVFRERIRTNALSAKKNSRKKRQTSYIVVELSYDDAECVTKFLASKRHLAQSFNTYLTQILKILGETTVTVRSRGLKALSDVVEVDPNILTRHEVWAAVQARLNDQATQVREAAVELLGTFILGRPDIVSQYYQQIANRIGDTGLSVRKRVIKILRDLIRMTRKDPDFEFPQSADACMRILTCINDDDGVKKLVQETLYGLWFSPVEIFREMKSDEIQNHTENVINLRAEEICDTVVKLLEEERDGFLEALLDSLMGDQILKNEETVKSDDIRSKKDDIRKICQNICDKLSDKLNQKYEQEEVLAKMEDGTENDKLKKLDSQGKYGKIVANFYTLSVFCRYDPRFLQENVYNIPPYLKTNVSPGCTMADTYIIVSAATILEKTIPYLTRPGTEFTNSIAISCQDILFQTANPGIINSTVNLLSTLTIHLTKRFENVWEIFFKAFKYMTGIQRKINNLTKKDIVMIKRLSVVIGHFARAFDLNSDKYKPKKLIKVDLNQKIFDLLIKFVNDENLKPIKVELVTAIGQTLLREPTKMVSNVDIISLYESNLEAPWSDTLTENVRIQVLQNLKEFLEDEDNKFMKFKESRNLESKMDGKTLDGEEIEGYDIRCLNDVSSSQGAAVMQKYLKCIEFCLLSGTCSTRKAALDVVYLISFGGLVHPQSCIPLLMAASADSNLKIREKADSQLAKSQTNLLLSTALKGISLAYELSRNDEENKFRKKQLEIELKNEEKLKNGENLENLEEIEEEPEEVQENAIVRGYRYVENETGEQTIMPLCGFIYMQVRQNKRHRRSLQSGFPELNGHS